MNRIRTFTGTMINPLNPESDLIKIEDIAHALSMLCRANGHFKSFYSVCQHSINCMNEARARGYSKKVQLGALLHDASEAYLSDITRPVKRNLPGYIQAEKVIQSEIYQKYLGCHLNEEESALVLEIDNAILYHEMLSFMGVEIYEDKPTLLSTPVFDFTGFQECENEFLRLFRRLTAKADDFLVVGVDWMKPYWVAIVIDNEEISCHHFENIDTLCNKYLDANAILIDIPIGLPDSDTINLRPDSIARNYIDKRRQSSIFNVLPREIIYAKTKSEAWELNRKIDAKMSIVAEGLRSMTREVDMFLQKNPEWKNKLMESHPEIAFQILNGGIGLSHPKKTPEGQKERLKILKKQGYDLTDILKEHKAKEYPDVLDAASLAIHANLGLKYGFMTIPNQPSKDSTGLLMQMIFANI